MHKKDGYSASSTRGVNAPGPWIFNCLLTIAELHMRYSEDADEHVICGAAVIFCNLLQRDFFHNAHVLARPNLLWARQPPVLFRFKVLLGQRKKTCCQRHQIFIHACSTVAVIPYHAAHEGPPNPRISCCALARHRLACWETIRKPAQP